MISIEELREFINDQEIPNEILQNCIDLAVNRAKKLLNAETLQDTPEVRKALILLATAELSSQVNLYWRKAENHQVMNAKNLVAEAERLLNVVPSKGAIAWI